MVKLPDGREIDLDKVPTIDSGECVFHTTKDGRLELIFLRGDIRQGTEVVARIVLAKEATPGFLLSMEKLQEFLRRSSPPPSDEPKRGH